MRATTLRGVLATLLVSAALCLLTPEAARSVSAAPVRILAADMEEGPDSDNDHLPFRFAAAALSADASGPSSSTNFMVSSVPRHHVEVTFDKCGKPLCPPATVFGPPPPAYECDCTEIVPHPDCIPICKAKNQPANAFMPHQSCTCPYGVSLHECPCGGPQPLVGEGFPITVARDLSVPHKPSQKPFTPSVEPPNPLPPIHHHMCRPNIAKLGPGTCRTAPKSADCKTPGSNCYHSSSCGSSGSQSGSCGGKPARELSCKCKFPPPAPCRCVNVTGSKSLVDDAEGFKGSVLGIGQSGSLVDAFAKQIADKVLSAIAPQLQAVPVPQPPLPTALISPEKVKCTTREDCNKKFDELLASGDPQAEKQLLLSETKHLKELAAEYKRMETALQKKISRQISKSGSANPDLNSALKRIKQQNARLQAAIAKSSKEAQNLARK